MKTLTNTTVAVAALTLAAGCGSQREQFRPAEQATGQTLNGYEAAEYDLMSQEGSIGEAKVWTRGAYRADVGGERRTVVHVGIDVENELGQPIALDARSLSLAVAADGEMPLAALQPSHVTGALTAPPYGDARVDAYFTLPQGFSPQDVDAFRIRWRVSSDGWSYAQRTPFLEYEPQYATTAYYYYTPLYDPFWYEPFYHPGFTRVYRRPYRHVHELHRPVQRVHVRDHRR